MTFNRLRLGFVPGASHPRCVRQLHSPERAVNDAGFDCRVSPRFLRCRSPGRCHSHCRTATGFTVNLVADGSGYFKAPLLEPGKYTVTITSPNFAKYRADDVLVVVGQVTSLEPRLAVASSSTQVVVTEQTPVMNLESPDFTDTLNTAALQNVPINNRRWSALALTTPGVVADSTGFGLVSVRGISIYLNNVEIDGADDNQAYFSSERGYTAKPIPLQAAPSASSPSTPASTPLNTAALPEA
jgi:hypothetical protein